MSKLLHYLSSIQSGVWGEDQKNNDADTKCIRVADFVYGEFSYKEPETVRNVPEANKYHLQRGDILIEKSGGGEKTTVGRAIHMDDNQEFVYANFIDRLRPKNSKYGKYLTYLLAHLYSIRVNTKYIKQNTGIQNLDIDGYIREDINLPSERKWEEIALFLDNKLEKINEAIAKKKHLLELLEEKRTSVINNAVNNSDGEKIKIKHIAAINPNIRNKFKYSETVSFIPMEAVSEFGQLSLQTRKIEEVISGYTYFEEHDVVIAKITPCFENGKAAVMKGLKNEFGFGTTEFIILRAGKKILPQYLYYIIFSRHFRENGINEMRGTAGQKRLTESYVGHYTFKLPTLNNQEIVIDDIKKSTNSIDLAKNKITNSISLLEEYKTSLISNAVTGNMNI